TVLRRPRLWRSPDHRRAISCPPRWAVLSSGRVRWGGVRKPSVFELRSRAMGVPRSGVGLPASLMLSLTLMLMLAAPGVAQAQAQRPTAIGSAGVYWVYVGTYTSGEDPDRSRGIYLMELDVRSGTLDAPRLAVATPNPSFLAIH